MKNTEVGLLLCRAFMIKHGIQCVPRGVIALWCGCSNEAIRQIEERALRKLRRYGIFTREDLGYVRKILNARHALTVSW